jgi:hypothetical protein
VLRWFARAGYLQGDHAKAMMAGWHRCGGFSDPSVHIEGADRAGLEPLLRYCARPPFALRATWSALLPRLINVIHVNAHQRA